jgi:hypothetical protein
LFAGDADGLGENPYAWDVEAAARKRAAKVEGRIMPAALVGICPGKLCRRRQL